MWRQSFLLVTRGYRGSSICPKITLRLLSHALVIDPNQYTTALYNKLSLQDQYQFLDTALTPQDFTRKDDNLLASAAFRDFVNILAHESDSNTKNLETLQKIQHEFCEKFTSWTKMSQLRIGFLMYLDSRIEADDYLEKVIKHIGSMDLFDASPHDLTTLLLLIYFKRDLSVEDVSEFMDVDVMMNAFAELIRKGSISRDEVLACCLGMKRISSLSVTSTLLRTQLYHLLTTFKSVDHLDDFYLVTLMTTLSKGSMIFKDQIIVVEEMMKNLQTCINNLQLETAIKVITYPLTLNFVDRKLEEMVLPRAISDLSSLNTRDMRSLCHYLSKTKPSELNNYTSPILVHLEDNMKRLSNLQELSDIMECFHYLSHNEAYSESFNDVVFQALARVPEHKQEFDIKEVSLVIAQSLGSSLGMDTSKFSLTTEKEMAIFSRIPVFICSSYQVDRELKVSSVKASVLSSISSHFQKNIPIHVHSPMMTIKDLDKRNRELVKCYRVMTRFLGSEEFCRVTRILPHFGEPDIIFGNIGGICMTVPQYLWESGFVGVRRPPPGDWYVLVIGTKKSLDRNNQVVGQEAAKMSQLKKLGYEPVILPYIDVIKGDPQPSLIRILKGSDVWLPNLDDGIHEQKRKF